MSALTRFLVCHPRLWLLLVLLVPARAGASELYFPPVGTTGSWQTVAPAEAGFDPQRLEAVLEFARQQRSSGLVILHQGRIVAERYWDPDDIESEAPAVGRRRQRGYDQRIVGRDAAGRAIEDVASAQKSVSAILAGLAQERGLLKINAPVHKYLGTGWSQATPEQEAAITVRHLLTMTSGLDEELKYEVPPGTRWFYNSAAYARVLMCTTASAKMDRNELTKEWLTGIIGMSDSRWVERPIPAGLLARNDVGFATTARDLARFGLLILANGEWNGQTVIRDKEYLRDALRPSQELNPSYGYLWWLNGQERAVRGRQLINRTLVPTAPPDLVAAYGAFQRKLYVVRSLDLVVTRLGDNADPLDSELWRLIMAARVEP